MKSINRGIIRAKKHLHISAMTCMQSEDSRTCSASDRRNVGCGTFDGGCKEELIIGDPSVLGYPLNATLCFRAAEKNATAHGWEQNRVKCHQSSPP